MTAFERAFFSAPTTRRLESRRCRLKACSTQRLRTIHTHLKQSTPIIQSTRMLNKMRTLLLITLLCAVAAAQVRYEDILKGPGRDWLTYSGSYGGWRHSPLEQITAKNARMLSPQWVYHVPDARALRTSPLVYKGVMYVTNSNSVYALDARTGRLVWQYLDARAKDKKANRGAAILGERVYFTTGDNYLTALDRQTGVVIFSRKFADASKGIGP